MILLYTVSNIQIYYIKFYDICVSPSGAFPYFHLQHLFVSSSGRDRDQVSLQGEALSAFTEGAFQWKIQKSRRNLTSLF